MLNTFCPGLGSNQDLLRGSQTLYRVAIKAGLYRKAVQVRIIPNITTLTLLCVVQFGWNWNTFEILCIPLLSAALKRSDQ